MSLNRTVTGLTHYDIQQRRRKKVVEDARATHRGLVRKADVDDGHAARSHRLLPRRRR